VPLNNHVLEDIICDIKAGDGQGSEAKPCCLFKQAAPCGKHTVLDCNNPDIVQEVELFMSMCEY
jgi:hypothetical protein